MKTVQQDLKSNNLSLNEATDVAQNLHSLETEVYARSYALLVVHGRNQRINHQISDRKNDMIHQQTMLYTPYNQINDQ